ncbi:MAG: 50S ribosomal protein L24 [Patescibacteria group bacterium]
MIKKDTVVKVLAGADRGKTGKVLRVFPKINRVLVEGINIKKKHQKGRRKDQKGQIVEVSTPIHISNVALNDKKADKKEAKKAEKAK